MSRPDTPARHGPADHSLAGRTLLSGLLLGIGAAAFADEAVFHQLLHWHHFYDRGTPAAGLVSDGLLHASGWFATVAGLFLYADLRRRGAGRAGRWWGAVLLGAGGFQVFDGTVHHKLLRLHQVRYGVDPTPYDWGWNLAGAVLALAGAAVLLRSRRTAPAAAGR